jgi:hypothetical protein
MTEDERIAQQMADQGYEPTESGGWVKKVKRLVPLCCICFSREPKRGQARCDDCGTNDD